MTSLTWADFHTGKAHAKEPQTQRFAALLPEKRNYLVAASRMGMAMKISQPGCHSPHSKPSSR